MTPIKTEQNLWTRTGVSREEAEKIYGKARQSWDHFYNEHSTDPNTSIDWKINLIKRPKRRKMFDFLRSKLKRRVDQLEEELKNLESRHVYLVQNLDAHKKDVNNCFAGRDSYFLALEHQSGWRHYIDADEMRKKGFNLGYSTENGWQTWVKYPPAHE